MPSAGMAGLIALAIVVALFIANWLIHAISGWFSWPLIVIGAIAFAAGMVVDNKNVRLIGVGMVLVGAGLLLLGGITGFAVTLITTLMVVAIFFAAVAVLVSLKRKA